MSVRIQLNNNHWYDAVQLPGEQYQATLPSGKIKIYPLSSIKQFVLTNEENTIIANKEEKMINNPIHHYLREMTINGVTFVSRVITNEKLTGKVALGYEQSKQFKRPMENVFAIESGTWLHHLLRIRLAERGLTFKMIIIENKDLLTLTDESLATVEYFLNDSNFMFANADYSFFLFVEGCMTYGLDIMGLEILSAKKSAKRLQEISRQVEMYTYLETGALDIGFKDFEMEGEYVKFFDGKSYIRKSFALRMAANITDPKRRMRVINQIHNGELVQVTLRILTPFGLIKGDAIIVKDGLIPNDIVTHPENLKTELATDGWTYACAWEHAMVHNAVWDVQSEINFKAALTEAHHSGDMLRIVKTVRESLAAGTLPEYLLLDERAHKDDGTVDMEKLSDSINRSYVRWQAHGLDIRAAQNLTFMAINGVIKRMQSSEMRNGFYIKMWTPMSNAVLLTVNTWESAVHMGGIDFKGHNRDVCFYDPRAGFIISGNRFAKTYNYHGGWDLDDSMKVIIVKVHCSDPEILKLHLNKTVPNTYIPAKAEDAKEMVLLVRSPNGPGEWSIEECEIDTLPIPAELRHNDITVVDLAHMPLPQDELIKDVTLGLMPSGMTFTKQPMTRDESKVMIEAQLHNPGVGRFCNAMMVWSAANDGFPASMLAPMETIVDTVQQEHDLTKFLAIEEESGHVLEQLIATGKSVDKYLANTRVPLAVRRQLRQHEGRLTRLHKLYVQIIKTLNDEIRNHTLQMRMVTNEVRAVRAMKFGEHMLKEVVMFNEKYVAAMALVDHQFKVDKMDSPFYKMTTQSEHQIALRAIVDEMVTTINNMADPESFVMALYKLITTPTRTNPLGMSDRIIFQPNAAGENSVMDILIEAFVNCGLGTAVS